MTIIVGYKEKGKAILASDGLVTFDSHKVMPANFNKIIDIDGWMGIGCTGSVRGINLLQASHEYPLIEVGEDPFNYLVNSLIPTLTTILLEGNCYSADEAGKVVYANSFLVVIDARLFIIDSFGAICEYDTYACDGVGSEYANGALYALTVNKDTNLDPKQKIKLAIQAASHYHSGCGGKVFMKEYKKIDKKALKQLHKEQEEELEFELDDSDEEEDYDEGQVASSIHSIG